MLIKDENSKNVVPIYGQTLVGYIDQAGVIVITPRFDRGMDFSEGLAYVEKDNFRGFINRRGDVVIELQPEIQVWGNWEIPGFHEGLAAVRGGFIDRSGKLVINGYRYTESFSNGVAPVTKDIGRDVKYGFINKKGEIVIPFRFEPRLGHHGFIDYLGGFSDGLARVKVGDVYGYINTRGDYVIPPRFPYAENFSDGLAFVSEGNKAGYIDKAWQWIIIAKDWVSAGGRFSEGLAAITFHTINGPKTGYIDHQGKVVIKPRFDSAEEFIDGVAKVYELRNPDSLQEARFGYIDKNGNYIWEPQSGP